MSDPPRESSDPDEAARMKLGAEAIHETDDGIYLDCPQCGSNVSIVQVVTQGRCTGQLDDDIAETEPDTQLEEGCNAELSLELIWHA